MNTLNFAIITSLVVSLSLQALPTHSHFNLKVGEKRVFTEPRGTFKVNEYDNDGVISYSVFTETEKGHELRRSRYDVAKETHVFKAKKPGTATFSVQSRREGYTEYVFNVQ